MGNANKDWAPEYVIAFEKYEDLVRFAEQDRLNQASLNGRAAIGKITDWVEEGGVRGAVCTIKPLKGTKLCKDEMPPLQVQIDLGNEAEAPATDTVEDTAEDKGA